MMKWYAQKENKQAILNWEKPRSLHRRTPRSSHLEDPGKTESAEPAAPFGVSTTSTGKQDAHDTKSVTIQHKVQILWVQRKVRYVAKKAAAGSANKLQRQTTTSG